jgi:hypothetical protein
MTEQMAIEHASACFPMHRWEYAFQVVGLDTWIVCTSFNGDVACSTDGRGANLLMVAAREVS